MNRNDQTLSLQNKHRWCCAWNLS